MNKAIEWTMRFCDDEEGMETVEYAVMTGLIAAGLIAAITLLTLAVAGRFTTVSTQIN